MSQLAVVLGVAPATLSYWLYKAPPAERYVEYTIAKRNGGFRHIRAPKGMLKYIQSRLAELLRDIYNDLEQRRASGKQNKNDPAPCVLAHGFKPGYNITTNADAHRGKRFVFNTDLESFFPSINFGRVRGFFMRDHNFNLSADIATLIAQIACHRNELPQGAPCSPVISNFVAHMLDIKLNKLAVRNNCTYTRYADDLTFSTNERKFPEQIARLVAGTTDRFVAGDGLLNRVYASGFRVNHDKSRMQLWLSRQDATGLVVNNQINVPVEYYKQTRAMCDRLFREGYSHRQVKAKWEELSSDRLQGRMDFIYAVRRSRLKTELLNVSAKDRQSAYIEREKRFEQQQIAFSKLYRHLLNYRSFHGISHPVLVGEGITDGLYVRAAIQTIGHLFPNLYENGLVGNVLLDFYKHTEKRKYYQIGEGASGLQHFAVNFQKLMSPFKLTPQHPVILLVDNDEEGKKVLKAVGDRYKKKIDSYTTYAHLTGNLYILPVPLRSGKSATIEDLFEPSLLDEKLEHRSFSKANNYDKATHYGKAEFVGKIVRPRRQMIKWDGFEPLLKNLEEIILDYQHQLTTVNAGPAVAP